MCFLKSKVNANKPPNIQPIINTEVPLIASIHDLYEF